MGRLVSAAKTYSRWATMLSDETGHSRTRVLFRMTACRLAYGAGPEVFDVYGAIDRPLSVVREHLEDDEREALQRAKAAAGYRYLEQDKAAFAARCNAAGLPTVPLLAVIADDDACAHGFTPVAGTPESLDRVLAPLGDRDLILKRARGGRGYGVFSLPVRNGRPCAPPWSPQRSGPKGSELPQPTFDDAAGLLRWLRSLTYKPFAWLLQPHLRPHADLLPLMPGPGLGTVRIHTFLTRSGDLLVRWPVLKIPGRDSVQDNFRGGRGGSLAALLDDRTGTIVHAVGRDASDHPIRFVELAPGSDTRLRGFRLPCWPDLLDVVSRAAQAFPELPALGWDIAITPDGPVIIEANWEFGTNLPAMALRRGLRTELQEYLSQLAEPHPADVVAAG